MPNLVDEIDVLKMKIDLEGELRSATDIELRNDIESGPMQMAHNASIEAVVQACRALIEKFDSGG